MTHGFCTCEELSDSALVVWTCGDTLLKKKKNIIFSVSICLLYLAVLCAGPEKGLDSASLSASNSVGMPHVKRLQSQDFGKKAASLCVNKGGSFEYRGTGAN